MLRKARLLTVRDVLCPSSSHIDEVRIEGLLLELEEENRYEVVIAVRIKDRRGIHVPRDVWVGVFEDRHEALRSMEDKLYDLSRFNDLGFGCHESSEVDQLDHQIV